jgi:ABC-2 type transport system ATP-binding protein
MSTMCDTIVEVRGLRKAFNGLQVLDGIDLSVRRGSVFALLGPNGAGKTTLVSILATLLKPDEGDATVGGHSVLREPEAVRRLISLTGQFAAVDKLLTGEENMLMMGRLHHLSRADARRRTGDLLERFDLEEAARRPVKQYSGGMRRRLDLAMSLLAAPPIIFLDEPTTGLDPRSRLAMWASIKELVGTGITIVLTTQYLEEADQLADVVAVIDGGQIIAEGTPGQLKQRIGRDRLVLDFAGDTDLARALTAMNGRPVDHDPEARRLSVALTDSVSQVRHILGDLERAEVKVEAISLRKPTLDDVFLQLTGRQAASEEEKRQPHG